MHTRKGILSAHASGFRVQGILSAHASGFQTP